MKVKELVQELLKLDQELNVWVSCSDGDDLSYHDECRGAENAYLFPEYGPFAEEICDEADKQKYEKVVLVS